MQENCSLKRVLEEIQKEKEQTENNKKWQPMINETYYYLGSGEVCAAPYDNNELDKWRISQCNCFQTREEAEKRLENLKTKAELKALADELNGDEVIDWNNLDQDKHYLIYDVYNHRIGYSTSELCMISGNVYCLDEDFKTKAIRRIGEQRLIEMIKSRV
jgi:hypothetical protein